MKLLLQTNVDLQAVADAIRTREATGLTAIDEETLLECAGVSFASALVDMGHLGREEKRFDFGVWRTAMLEYLPVLVSSTSAEMSANHVALAANQVALMAKRLINMTIVAPKDMPLIGALDEAADV